MLWLKFSLCLLLFLIFDASQSRHLSPSDMDDNNGYGNDGITKRNAIVYDKNQSGNTFGHGLMESDDEKSYQKFAQKSFNKTRSNASSSVMEVLRRLIHHRFNAATESKNASNDASPESVKSNDAGKMMAQALSHKNNGTIQQRYYYGDHRREESTTTTTTETLTSTRTYSAALTGMSVGLLILYIILACCVTFGPIISIVGAIGAVIYFVMKDSSRNRVQEGRVMNNGL